MTRLHSLPLQEEKHEFPTGKGVEDGVMVGWCRRKNLISSAVIADTAASGTVVN